MEALVTRNHKRRQHQVAVHVKVYSVVATLLAGQVVAVLLLTGANPLPPGIAHSEVHPFRHIRVTIDAACSEAAELLFKQRMLEGV